MMATLGTISTAHIEMVVESENLAKGLPPGHPARTRIDRLTMTIMSASDEHRMTTDYLDEVQYHLAFIHGAVTTTRWLAYMGHTEDMR
jgi:hypothetical protein